jgi:HEAT repeat protein
MSILPLLATSLQRRDEVPNQELAKQIAAQKDKKAIQELVDNLQNNNSDIQHDCIKVLYEIGAINPSLITGYATNLMALLDHKNNRMQWGAMMAIYSITTENPQLVYAALPNIIACIDKGSVITKDYGVNILIALCAVKQYAANAFTLLIEQLISSPANQLPMYAEKAMPVIHDLNKERFINTLSARLGDIEKYSKRKRVEQVIKKLNK